VRIRRALAVLTLLIVGAAAGVAAQTPPTPQPPAGDAATGKQLFVKMSCHYCHGTEGQGSMAGIGPRIALVQRSHDSFARYVRRPTGRMTGYSEQILDQAALADIYAFLRSLPPSRSASEIPLLQQLRKR
jgi:mono/diheme cytochrome c family protein